MSCSKAFRASLTAYDLAMEVVKDAYFKPYILAAGDFPGCLFMTLPRLPPLPPHLYPLSSHLLPFFPPLSLLRMLPLPFLRAPTLPPQFPSSPPLSFPSPLLLSHAHPAPLPRIVLPPFPPTLLLLIFPLPPITLPPPFLLSLILSTPSFSAYVLLTRVRSSSIWAFTVRLCVCCSSPFLGPWGVST